MNKRRRVLSVIFALAAVIATLALFACSSAKKGGDKIVYTFVISEGQSITVSGKKGEDVKFPDDPKRDGYVFDGWYLSSDCTGSAVTEAKYDKKTTFYAKWDVGYALTLDLDGGTADGYDGSTLYVKKDTPLYTYLQAYEPVKGEYRFGCWYDGDTRLADNAVMPQAALSLTAKYMAKYTVKVSLQKADDLSEYEVNNKYLEDYALIDEEFTADILIGGFDQDPTDEITLLISADTSKNVFDFHYDRKDYSLSYSSNAPAGGTSEIINKGTKKYGVSFNIEDALFEEPRGYKFIGWADKSDATRDEVITSGKYTLVHDNTTLYAVWNKGFTDMFGGEDFIFVDSIGAEDAILVRGEVEFAGKYRERSSGFYDFKNKSGDIIITAKLHDNGKFVYYENRSATYELYLPETNDVDSDVTLTVDNTNAVTYNSKSADNPEMRKGSYSITEDGIYLAEFEDGTSFEYMIGKSRNRDVFRKRGEEASYGQIPLMSRNYPVITLDGFGYATFDTGREVTYYAYSIKDNVVTLAMNSGSVVGSVKIMDYSGRWGYEFYEKSYDLSYKNVSGAVLTTNGCSTGVYYDGTRSYVGTFTAKRSYITDGYVITITVSKKEYRFVTTTKGGDPESKNGSFRLVADDYAEYNYLPFDGYYNGNLHFDAPPLAVEGNTASRYNEDGSLLDSGAISENSDGSYTYTPSSGSALILHLNAGSVAVDFYYLESEDNDDYALYTASETGSTAKLTVISSLYARYTDPDGKSTVGSYDVNTDFDYLALNGGDEYLYFKLDKVNNKFTRLYAMPTLMTMINATEGETGSMSVTGNSTVVGDERRYEASYYSSVSGKKDGYYTGTVYDKSTVFTFYDSSDTPVIRFTTVASLFGYGFYRYELTGDIALATYKRYTDSDTTDETATLAKLAEYYTPAGSEEKYIVYKRSTGSGDEYGYLTSDDLVIFEEHEVTRYTFHNKANDDTFFFTFYLGSYYRECAENGEQFTNGSETLTLDGATHIARYVDANGDTYDSYYVAETQPLDETARAIKVSIDRVITYFDINGSTFKKRGGEWGSYLVVDNEYMKSIVLTLDGHGNGRITDIDDDFEPVAGTEIDVTYELGDEDNSITVYKEEQQLYKGNLGLGSINGNTVAILFCELPANTAGYYYDSEALTVLVLDGSGSGTFYAADGASYGGRYVLVDDGLIYFYRNDGNFSSLYKVISTSGDKREIQSATYNKTFYANDFSSVVFSRTGTVLFNNGDVKFFTEEGGNIYTYTQDENADNVYGFTKELFDIRTDSNGTYVMYNSTRYNLFDRQEMIFKDGEDEIVFTPTGEPTFNVPAIYTKKGEQPKDYNVIVTYDEGNVKLFVARRERITVADGRSEYTFIKNFDATFDIANRTFSFDTSKYKAGLDAYSYPYLYYIYNFGVANIQKYRYLYGEIYTYVETDGVNTEYKISGGFRYLNDTDGNMLVFSDGTLSDAGYYHEQYGNLYMCEFEAADGETYHMNFFIVDISGDGSICAYFIHSISRKGETLYENISLGQAAYSETFLYSDFIIPKPGKTDEYFMLDGSSGQEFYPSLVYGGKFKPWHSCSYKDGIYLFETAEYEEGEQKSYCYYFSTEENNKSITRYNTGSLTTSDSDHISIAIQYYDLDEGEISAEKIFKVVGIRRQSGYEEVISCEKQASDPGVYVYRLITANGSYILTLTVTEEGGNKTCRVQLVSESNNNGN